MLSKDPAVPQASPSSSVQAVAAGIPIMNAGDPIEVGPQGSPTINDPSTSDNNKPPGAVDLELFLG